MLQSERITFGDRVRVRSTKETIALQVAGFVGQVYGETMPSVSGVLVVGSPTNDHALNVNFDEQAPALWFAPDLLELVDHGAGTEARLDGSLTKWVRTTTGEWFEKPID